MAPVINKVDKCLLSRQVIIMSEKLAINGYVICLAQNCRHKYSLNCLFSLYHIPSIPLIK